MFYNDLQNRNLNKRVLSLCSEGGAGPLDMADCLLDKSPEHDVISQIDRPC